MADTDSMELLSDSQAQTENIGEAIGQAARPGDLVGLLGELGAGKTRLVKGIARGLGLSDRNQVRSPTFVLIREHQGRLRLFHVDAYRLSGPDELGSLGFDEILSQGGLTVVEWADHVAPGLPEDRLTVHLDITGPQCRRIRLDSGGPRSSRLLDRIRRCRAQAPAG